METYKDKPSELVLDIIVLEESEIDDPLIHKMLEDCIVLYDGLGIRRNYPAKHSCNTLNTVWNENQKF